MNNNNNTVNNTDKISIVDELRKPEHEDKIWSYEGTIFGTESLIANSKDLADDLEELLRIIESEYDSMIDHPNYSGEDTGYYFQSGDIWYKSGSLINELVFCICEFEE